MKRWTIATWMRRRVDGGDLPCAVAIAPDGSRPATIVTLDEAVGCWRVRSGIPATALRTPSDAEMATVADQVLRCPLPFGAEVEGAAEVAP